MEKIYFDNVATTPVAPEVLEAMLPFLKENYGNASSIHSFGKTAKVLLESARENVADYLGTKPKEIFFTSGGTESNNFAIKGVAFSNLQSKNNHIITSSIEHPAVLESISYLKEKFNFKVEYIKPKPNGVVSIYDIENFITQNTILISLMHANNEIGSVNNIKKLSEISERNKIFLHSDTVQSIGKLKFNLNELNINFASLSAHKIYGPKGIGVIYIREGTILDKYFSGGAQERNMRAGTENIPAIAGLNEAINLLRKNIEKDIIHYNSLKIFMSNELLKLYNNKIIFNSNLENGLPNIINISFMPDLFKIDTDTFHMAFDLKGVAISAGSACSSGSLKPSRILLEIGRNEKTALSSLRISFGRYNTKPEVEKFLEILKEVIIEK